MSSRSLFRAVLLAQIACGTGQTPSVPVPEPPLVLAPAAGTTVQAALTGAMLPQQLAVRLTRDGEVVSGEAITWSTESGHLVQQFTATDQFGFARAQWMLGDQPGTWRAVASLTRHPEIKAEFQATALERVVPSAVAGSGRQQVTVTGSVQLMLRVVSVATGSPRAGIPVTWSMVGSAAALLSPGLSVTDIDGIASTWLTVGQTAGAYQARASVRGAPNLDLTYEITAVPGTPSVVTFLQAPDSIPVNWQMPWAIRVGVSDAYGNPAPAGPLSWEVLGDGLALLVAPQDSASYIAAATAIPTGPTGTVQLSVRVLGAGQPTLRSIRLVPPAYLILFDTQQAVFRSQINGTHPAVDTIPLGATMHWVLQPFDYENHEIEISGGAGVIGGGPFPYGNPSMVSAQFTAPGTFTYRDTEYGVTGVVVVNP